MNAKSVGGITLTSVISYPISFMPSRTAAAKWSGKSFTPLRNSETTAFTSRGSGVGHLNDHGNVPMSHFVAERVVANTLAPLAERLQETVLNAVAAGNDGRVTLRRLELKVVALLFMKYLTNTASSTGEEILAPIAELFGDDLSLTNVKEIP